MITKKSDQYTMNQRITILNIGIVICSFLSLFSSQLLAQNNNQQQSSQKDLSKLDSLVTLPLNDQAVPPAWALMERQLLDKTHHAALEFAEKYTREDGTLIWRKEWPGMDGSDDGYESFYNFPLYYALGGGDAAFDSLARHLWEGVTRQFTEYGQIYNEFDAGYDWMHHGEAYTNFYFFGLSDPANQAFRERAVKFAEMYTDGAKENNYDGDQNIIRSPLNGSRGPRFINTAKDWVTHRPILADYPLPYDDIPNVDSSKAWIDEKKFPYILDAINNRMMKGDVPLNLTATSLMLNAYMYTSDEKYTRWVREYVAGWQQRVEENNGILPDNVGLNGQIGENMDGKWYGGYYGWEWPHGLFNQLESTVIGASNAYLATGDSTYLDLPRSVLNLVREQGKRENGKLLVPHRHGDQGWYDYRPLNPKFPTHLWYISRDERDWDLVTQLYDTTAWDQLDYHKSKGDSDNPGPWLGYLAGQNPDYPMEILKATYGEMQRRLQMIRTDDTTPDDQDVHHWLQRNPVILEGLVQLMLGAPNHIYHGGLLHTSVRYFDPQRMRSGIPEDVAALVDQINDNGISLQLVNLHPSDAKEVIIQAGMFGEHQFGMVKQVEQYPYQFKTVDDHAFMVELAPGSVGSLEIEIDRFVNKPTYLFPWY